MYVRRPRRRGGLTDARAPKRAPVAYSDLGGRRAGRDLLEVRRADLAVVCHGRTSTPDFARAAGPQRIEVLKKKYPEYEEHIELLAAADPSGEQLKYLDWSTRQFIKEVPPLGDIYSTIERGVRASKENLRVTPAVDLNDEDPERPSIGYVGLIIDGSEWPHARAAEGMLATMNRSGKYTYADEVTLERLRPIWEMEAAKAYANIAPLIKRFHSAAKYLGMGRKRLDAMRKKLIAAERLVGAKPPEGLSHLDLREWNRQAEFAERDAETLRMQIPLAEEAAGCSADINKYGSGDIAYAVYAAEAYAATTLVSENADYDVVYADDEWTVYDAKNKEAACLLGSGSDWCVSSWEDNHWEEYTEVDDWRLLVWKHKTDTMDYRGAELPAAYMMYVRDGEVSEFKDRNEKDVSAEELGIGGILDAVEVEGPEPLVTVFIAIDPEGTVLRRSRYSDFEESFQDEERRGRGWVVYSGETTAEEWEAYTEWAATPTIENLQRVHVQDPETEPRIAVTNFAGDEVFWVGNTKPSAETWIEQNEGFLRPHGFVIFDYDVPIHLVGERDSWPPGRALHEKAPRPAELVVLTDEDGKWVVSVGEEEEAIKDVGAFRTKAEALHYAEPLMVRGFALQVVSAGMEEMVSLEELRDVLYEPAREMHLDIGALVLTPEGVGRIHNVRAGAGDLVVEVEFDDRTAFFEKGDLRLLPGDVQIEMPWGGPQQQGPALGDYIVGPESVGQYGKMIDTHVPGDVETARMLNQFDQRDIWDARQEPAVRLRNASRRVAISLADLRV